MRTQMFTVLSVTLSLGLAPACRQLLRLRLKAGRWSRMVTSRRRATAPSRTPSQGGRVGGWDDDFSRDGDGELPDLRRILAKSSGYIKYNIVSSGAENSIYKVVIKALVATGNLSSDVDAINAPEAQGHAARLCRGARSHPREPRR